LTSECKKCRKKYQEIYKIEHSEKRKETNKKYKDKNKEKIKKYRSEYNLLHRDKRTYGLKIDDYNLILKKQNNKCSICGKELKKGSGGRALDHCHITGKIRGILCMKCNTSLGLVEENINILQSMITYLELHKTIN
jgi:hypothetical protein